MIAWAAMQWLPTQESSVSKGFQLENIPVLLLRILMLLFLVLLLSQVFIPRLGKAGEERIIHLVQPSSQISEEYKFELLQALENDEEVYWADKNLTAIEDLDDLNSGEFEMQLQSSLDKIPEETTKLNVYLSNSQQVLGEKNYLSKVKPIFFLGSADLPNQAPQTISIAGGRMLEVNQYGLLDSIPSDQKKTGSITIAQSDMTYFMGDLTSSERVFVNAALEAIQDVYGFDFVEKESELEAKLIFASKLPNEKVSDKLYFISSSFSFSEQSNLITFSDQLDFEHSELVQTGKLPEVILKRFLAYSGVGHLDVKLSQAQLEHRFLVDTSKNKNKKANLNLVLLSLLLLCFAAERYFANRQGI